MQVVFGYGFTLAEEADAEPEVAQDDSSAEHARTVAMIVDFIVVFVWLIDGKAENGLKMEADADTPAVLGVVATREAEVFGKGILQSGGVFFFFDSIVLELRPDTQSISELYRFHEC